MKKDYDEKTGLPTDKTYLEMDLPPYLNDSIKAMQSRWDIIEAGGRDRDIDLYWSELNADINCAEVDGNISSTQAWYLREKYLGMRKEDNT